MKYPKYYIGPMPKFGKIKEYQKYPEWNSYRCMIQRCYYTKDKAFSYYRSLNIYVCTRWISSFKRFLLDMGPRPGPEYTLDRIDPELGYFPSNCRWATKKEQTNNTIRKKYANSIGPKSVLFKRKYEKLKFSERNTE